MYTECFLQTCLQLMYYFLALSPPNISMSTSVQKQPPAPNRDASKVCNSALKCLTVMSVSLYSYYKL